MPFTTAVEGSTANVRLTSASTPLAAGAAYGARAFGGQSLSWNVANIPAGTIFAMVNLDINATQPGFQGPGITAPGCRISTTLSPVILGFETWLLPPSSVTGVATLPIPHTIWDGVDIIVQAIGLDVFGGPDMVPWASNAIKHTVGLD